MHKNQARKRAKKGMSNTYLAELEEQLSTAFRGCLEYRDSRGRPKLLNSPQLWYYNRLRHVQHEEFRTRYLSQASQSGRHIYLIPSNSDHE